VETVYVRCDDVQGVGRALLARRPAGVRDVHPVFATIAVTWDPARIDRVDVERWIRAADPLPAAASRSMRVPVRYDGADLADIAAATGLDVGDVIARHSAPDYEVVSTGALPGQPFLAPNDEALRLPRRPSPRMLLAARSIAIANHLTTVYPTAAPGGWSIIGTSLQPFYDPHLPEPFLVAAGDRVRLEPSDVPDPPPLVPVELLPDEPHTPALRVDEPGLLDLVVDGGRYGAAHAGMAESGPADRGAALLANTLAGNPPGTPLVEMTMHGPQLTVLRPVVVGFAGVGGTLEVDGDLVGWRTLRLESGARLRVRGTNRGARSYLALAGGIEAHTFLGSASADIRGLIGRALRAGDVLGVAAAATPLARYEARPEPRDPTRPIRLLPGPQADPAAFAALCTATFTVGVGDRIGVRLDGPEMPGGEILSESPPIGALQITPGGVPIILLADRLRTAGYTKPALVHPHDLGRVAQLRAGDPATFAAAPEPAPTWYLERD
jgi:KipI family sensor histidine kinase inhibitor